MKSAQRVEIEGRSPGDCPTLKSPYTRAVLPSAGGRLLHALRPLAASPFQRAACHHEAAISLFSLRAQLSGVTVALRQANGGLAGQPMSIARTGNAIPAPSIRVQPRWRRSRNRHKARSGMHPSYAPFGYQNIDGPSGKRVIAPDEPEFSWRSAFATSAVFPLGFRPAARCGTIHLRNRDCNSCQERQFSTAVFSTPARRA
jgi:hypothetical protein